MFDTMTFTKIVGAFCGTLLVLLMGKWAAETIYHTGGGHGEDHAQGYVIEVAEAGDAGSAEEGPSFVELFVNADPSRGERVFNQCRACHSLEQGSNGTGPYLYGVVGRDVDTAEGYAYSGALEQAADVWTPEHLNEFLSGPAAYAPGTTMGFAGLRNMEDRANLIAYLDQTDGTTTEVELPATEEPAAEEAGEEGASDEGAAEEAATEEAADEGAATEATDAGAAEEAADEGAAAEGTDAGAAEEAADEGATAEGTDAGAAEEATDEGAAEEAATEEAAPEAGTAEEGATEEGATEEEAAPEEGAAEEATEEEASADTEANQEEAAADASGFAALVAAADVEAGESVFRRCQACHVPDAEENRVGPHLVNVVGRDIGSVDGFRYSDVMLEMEGEWTVDNLDGYLADPRGYAPGNRMSFAGLRDEEDRANVVAYLQSLAN